MRKTLIIWMAEPAAHAEALWQWREPVEPATVLATRSGSVAAALSEAGDADLHPRLTVLLPGERGLISRVNLPMRNRAKQLQAVPFMLEPELADDIRDLHFALGDRAANGDVPVVAIRSSLVQAVLDLLADAGLHADAVHLDAQCLSTPDDDSTTLTVFADATRIMLAPDDAPPVVLDAELADLVAEQASAYDGVDVYATADADAGVLEALPGPQRTVDCLLDALLQPGSAPINLLQGAFKPVSAGAQWWRPWKLAACLLVAVGALWLTQQFVQRAQLAAEVEALRTANLTEFQALFPSQTRIVDLEAQLSQQMARLRSSGGDGGLLFLLEQARPSLVAARDDVKLSELQYRDEALYVRIDSPQLSALESLATALRAQDTLTVERVSANSDSDGATMRLKLTTTG